MAAVGAQPSTTAGKGSVIGQDGQIKRDPIADIKASPGKLTGEGTIIRADGTVVPFTIESDITEAQAESLNLKP